MPTIKQYIFVTLAIAGVFLLGAWFDEHPPIPNTPAYEAAQIRVLMPVTLTDGDLVRVNECRSPRRDFSNQDLNEHCGK